jgi:hypothetical protein
MVREYIHERLAVAATTPPMSYHHLLNLAETRWGVDG